MVGYKGTTARNIVLQRREIVKDLHFFRRLSISQIVEYFKNEWAPRCIYKDIESVRDQFAKLVKQRDVQELIRRRITSHDNIIAHLWKCYDQLKDNPREQSYILNRINRAEDALIAVLQELGVIVKPEQTHSLTFADAITKGHEELKTKMELMKNVALKSAEIATKKIEIEKLKAQEKSESSKKKKVVAQ